MAETDTAEPAVEDDTDVQGTDDEIEVVASQAENPDAVRRALQAEREAAKKARRDAESLAAKLKELEDREKTDQERIAEERDTLRARVDPLESEVLRLRIGIEKGLPVELVDRLRGADREEMEADADQLLALVTKTPEPRGSADQGARDGGSVPRQVTEAQLKTMDPAAIEAARKEGRLNDLLGIRN